MASDEFASFARDFLDLELDESERIAALKGAIQACIDAESGDADDEPSKGDDKSALALIFGKAKQKKAG